MEVICDFEVVRYERMACKAKSHFHDSDPGSFWSHKLEPVYLDWTIMVMERKRLLLAMSALPWALIGWRRALV